MAGIATSGSDDLHGRARAHAARALDRRDGRAGTARRAVRRARDARRVRAGARLVARLGDGVVGGREAHPRPRDDRDRLPRVRARADGRAEVVRARRRRRLRRRPRARVLADPRRGAARVPDLDDRALADRARARAADLGSRRGRGRGISVVAALTRTQLAVLFAVLALGLLWLAWQSEPGGAGAPRGAAWDWVGAVTLVVGVAFALAAAMGHASTAWRNTMLVYKDRIFEHASWAFGALAIGIGVLPVLVGVAALARPKRRAARSRGRAPSSSTSVAALVVFVAYAGIKGAYISTVFSTLVVERNLIYLCPDPVHRDGAGLRARRRTRLGDRGRGDLHARTSSRRRRSISTSTRTTRRTASRSPPSRTASSAGRKGRSRACSSPRASSRSSSSSR